jgi:glycogen debranching enzyme
MKPQGEELAAIPGVALPDAAETSPPAVDPYQTEAPPELPDGGFLVLKHNDSFAVFNPFGDLDGARKSKQGFYIGGTRHLSRQRTLLNGRRPLLLSATAMPDSTRVVVDLMSPDIDGPEPLRSGDVHLSRSKRLWNGVLAERLVVRNYAQRAVVARVRLEFGSDFADVFEVRGMCRQKRGEVLGPLATTDDITLAYHGLDGATRWTVVRVSPRPALVWEGGVELEAALEPGAKAGWFITVSPDRVPAAPSVVYVEVGTRLREESEAERGRCCRIETTNDPLGGWVERSLADLGALITQTSHGPYPFAGVPWYSCPFGRDGIITALQTLWVDPDWARGVLAFLAGSQAVTEDPSRDAEPGKIVHEMREGEMAALGEIPFGRYYGTVDATPLFVVLAGEYHHVTGDTEFVRSIWPNVEQALAWIDRYGDPDGDGFVEYRNDSAAGLRNQGWKDSHDSVFHADGAEPEGPLALCEVQGYVYDAKRHASRLATELGMPERARELASQARRLRRRFDRSFWLEDLGTYALALCGDKRPCRVLTSNAGQCLVSRIAMPERAVRVARTMMGERMFSGWGVRTLAEGEPRYNPMSYHNGSVWPHDNAMIALGMSRYGLRAPVVRLLKSWLDASTHFELRRLPELMCGFDRARHPGPVLYPVACSPQAWAAGTVFMMLRACLGLTVDGAARTVRIDRPRLPEAIGEIVLRGIRVGQGRADLAFRQGDGRIDAAVLRKDPGVRVEFRA